MQKLNSEGHGRKKMVEGIINNKDKTTISREGTIAMNPTSKTTGGREKDK